MPRTVIRPDPTSSRLEHHVCPYVIINSIRLTHREVWVFQYGVFEDSLLWDATFHYPCNESVYFIIKNSGVHENSPTTPLEMNAFHTSEKISLQYNQQDATFSWSIYFDKLIYMFQAVSPPIIRSTKLYIQRQVLSNQYCCLLLSWMRWNSVPSHRDKHVIDVHFTVHRNKFPYSKLTRSTNFSYFSLEWNSTCFVQLLSPSSGVCNLKQSNGVCHTMYVWHIPLLYIRWRTPDDGKQIRSKVSQLKTQLVLWIFILFKVTTCFGLYHQAIIRSQVNNGTCWS
jgi:hypothetical protein